MTPSLQQYDIGIETFGVWAKADARDGATLGQLNQQNFVLGSEAVDHVIGRTDKPRRGVGQSH